MQAFETMLRVIANSGKSRDELSRMMGLSRHYLTTTIGKKSVVRLDNFARLADVCGYTLLVRHRKTGDEIVIDPPTTD